MISSSLKLTAPPPTGIVPAHQTSVYSYSVQQQPSLFPGLNGLSGHYQPQYQATQPHLQPTQPSATLSASQVPNTGLNPLIEPPAAHQASSVASTNIHEPMKFKTDSGVGMQLGNKLSDTAKAHSSIPPHPVRNEKFASSADVHSMENKRNSAKLPTKSQSPDVVIVEKDKNMHKRAEDLAGKISATVTITTNATSKLSGNNAREKNEFLAMQQGASTGSANKGSKHGSLQQPNISSQHQQKHTKPLQIGGKTLLDANKIVPNLSSLKPIPPSTSNRSKSFAPLIPNQPSSNAAAMMATITPIYSPGESSADQSTAFTPVTTKSSLREYRKPKPKSVQTSGSVFRSSTNASTNNRLSLSMSGEKHAPQVPDEISVTTVIGPPGNKAKAASSNHHQEPAIISMYPVNAKTTGQHGSVKRQGPEMLMGATSSKRFKSSSLSETEKPFPFPRGLTITEVNTPSTKQHTNISSLMINPLNVCATTLEQHHNEDDNDDEVIPVLHIPESSHISQSDPSKYRAGQKMSSNGKGSSYSRIPSGISNIRPLIQSSSTKAGMSGTSGTSGHPGMPSGLLRMTATSLQRKSFQSQLNVPQVPHTFINIHSRPSVTNSVPKIKPSSAQNMAVGKGNRLTLKPPKGNVPATITMSMAESAVSAVQPNTFKPVPVRSKAYSANSKQSLSGISGSPTKKGSQVSSPNSSRSSSRNSSLSPRDRSGSMSNKNANVSLSMSPKTSSSSTNSSSGTSSPKGTPSTKKKSPSNGYDPKAPLVSWHVRNSCSPKSCNGWNWEGEGKIQKVYLNVSRHANKFNFLSQYNIICIYKCVNLNVNHFIE